MTKIQSSTYSLLTAASLMIGNATAAVSFTFDYSSAPDFDATSRASLEDAANTVGSWLGHNAVITMEVTSSNVNSSTLASAGSNYAGAGVVGFGNQGVVAHKILTGNDLNGSGFDGNVDVNFFHNWDWDDNVAAGAYDFKSTAIHELLHAVGFASSIHANGNDGYFNSAGDPGMWEIFDKYVVGPNGTIIDGATYILNKTEWDLAREGGTGASGLRFNGPNAMAANGGNPVPLYSPTTWEEGSSGSHMDDDFYNPGGNGQNLLMNAATGTGPASRTMTGVERGILMDIGYTVVPEPSSTALVMLGAMGLLVSRRRS